MMKVVETVAKNPLAQINVRRITDAGNEIGSFETDLLEKTFIKIAGLLRVCFGEAGAGIIKSNLALDSHATALINPLLPGIRVYCIIGFCDIHQFDFVLKRLGKEVLVFVNTVASIVHEHVHSWEGSCNKNLGNSFVLIWRIGDEATLSSLTAVTQPSKLDNDGILLLDSVSEKNSSFYRSSRKSIAPVRSVLGREATTLRGTKTRVLDLRRLPGVDKLACKALIGFLKIIAEIKRSVEFIRYNSDPRLELRGERFKLRMGFGLHAGWAIEGAVGSLQKVDATYLSPHVNMAARLETASRQYGVPLLVSQAFHELLSTHTQKYLRRLDIVTVKGSETPIEIYTYDTSSRVIKRKLSPGSNKSPNTSFTQSRKISPPRRITDSAGDSTVIDDDVCLINNTSPLDRSPVNSVHTKMGFYKTKSSDSDGGSKKRTKSKFFRKSSYSSYDDPEEVIDRDIDIVNLRAHIDEAFLDEFSKGVTKYISGDWQTAKIHLEKSNNMMLENPYVEDSKGDGPSRTILKYMANYQYKAPSKWQGFRPLTSK